MKRSSMFLVLFIILLVMAPVLSRAQVIAPSAPKKWGILESGPVTAPSYIRPNPPSRPIDPLTRRYLQPDDPGGIGSIPPEGVTPLGPTDSGAMDPNGITPLPSNPEPPDYRYRGPDY